MHASKKTKSSDIKLVLSCGLNLVFLIVFITAGMYGTFLCSMVTSGSLQTAIPLPQSQSKALPKADVEQTAIDRQDEIAVPAPVVTMPAPAFPSHLMDNWATTIYKGSPERISFQKFTNSGSGIEASFWYSVEETLHSAQFIQTQEGGVVSNWLGKIQKRQAAGQSCNVLDIGSNGGYFSLLSRSVGCNVMAVDAQPWCLYRLSSSAAVNGYSDKLSITWGAVSDDPNLVLDVGATKCSGLWAVKNSEWINKESRNDVKVKSIRCVDIVSGWLGGDSKDIITVMKIDAEGSEVAIIRSALPLIKEKRILAIMAEFVPDRTQHITEFSIVVDTFTQLYAAGYACKLYRSAYSLRKLTDFFDMRIPMKGRGRPDMWECSLELAGSIEEDVDVNLRGHQ